MTISIRTLVPAAGLTLAALLGARADQVGFDERHGSAELAAFSVQALAVPGGLPAGFADALPDGFSVALELAGEPVVLDLQRHSLRSASFRVRVQDSDQDSDGMLRVVEAPPVATYRGTLRDRPGATVAGSLGADGLRATVRLAGGALWHIQPHQDGAHLVYAHADIADDGGVCGADAVAPVAPPLDAFPAAPGGGIAGGDVVALIAFDADWEFYQLHGGSVAATVSDIESIMAVVTSTFQNEVAISWEIGEIIVRTSPADPYQSMDYLGLLEEMRSHWNASHDDVSRDVAHLMTGRDLDGGYIGAAYTGVVCSSTSSGYGHSQSLYTTNFGLRFALTSHELGHNWSAQHCATECDGSPGDADCAVMCPCIGGCTGQLNLFGSSATAQIGAHRDAVSCIGGGDVGTPCPADLTGDGQVAVDDLVQLILAWGASGGPADLDGSGAVDVQDMVELVLAWGGCP